MKAGRVIGVREVVGISLAIRSFELLKSAPSKLRVGQSSTSWLVDLNAAAW
jgi:hypothetical protein